MPASPFAALTRPSLTKVAAPAPDQVVPAAQHLPDYGPRANRFATAMLAAPFVVGSAGMSGPGFRPLLNALGGVDMERRRAERGGRSMTVGDGVAGALFGATTLNRPRGRTLAEGAIHTGNVLGALYANANTAGKSPVASLIDRGIDRLRNLPVGPTTAPFGIGLGGQLGARFNAWRTGHYGKQQ